MKDGSSAFPNDGKWANGNPEGGMSLRDWFAGQALPSVIAAYHDANNPSIGTEHLPKNCAVIAYRIADAMLAERERADG